MYWPHEHDRAKNGDQPPRFVVRRYAGGLFRLPLEHDRVSQERRQQSMPMTELAYNNVFFN
jgi:hypothetical protein